MPNQTYCGCLAPACQPGGKLCGACHLRQASQLASSGSLAGARVLVYDVGRESPTDDTSTVAFKRLRYVLLLLRVLQVAGAFLSVPIMSVIKIFCQNMDNVTAQWLGQALEGNLEGDRNEDKFRRSFEMPDPTRRTLDASGSGPVPGSGIYSHRTSNEMGEDSI